MNYRELDDAEVTGYNGYYNQVHDKGAAIEKRLLANAQLVQECISKRENEIYSLAPILNIQVKKLETKLDKVVHQRKICEMINLKKHVVKTQEIKMDEDEDYEEELELFHGRYQSSYLVVDKSLPVDIPADETSEKSVVIQQSDSSHSPRDKFIETSKSVEQEVPVQSQEVRVPLSSNIKQDEKPEFVKKSEDDSEDNKDDDDDMEEDSS